MNAKIMVASVVAILGLGATVPGISALEPVPVQAKAKTRMIPKKWRGTWHSKAGYYYQTKHVKKNMNEPKMKATIHAKTVTWKWVGYRPKGFDKKTHVMRLGKKMGPQYYRLRGQVPYGILSYLAYDNAHHMLILYKGTHTDLYR
ncbi:hypothetical protein [Levilactobacillus namurensis]|uniref:hypothetical protein n=1 Tax=Levilactobacillus namurensis TaxID=380393 RepID=UPI00223118D9|nr:hypothetical protein [Levilactobacillus namurensis]MCW3779043.1 hypothetical protein [Levilactobacillus namurensis]MDT7019439.1 hypothetical protein [Levilactobacillus namurensis]WNN65968.1 hypothetical protein RIN67_02415 [Levilactobacillus namurensis]